MQYELTRDWKYTGGQEDGPGGKKLEAGTFLGSIEIADGIPMTPQMLADALLRKLAREVPEKAVDGPAATKPVVSRKAKAKAVDDA